MSVYNDLTVKGLEELLVEECFPNRLDIQQKIDFKSFIDPNEWHPLRAQEHLDKVPFSGICVTPGTERFFFNAILANKQKITGFVGRDLHPKVKAYNDFVIMLLKIANTVEEFSFLASCPSFPSWNVKKKKELLAQKTSLIRGRLQDFSLPERVKAYYLKHLEDLASTYYFAATHRWRDERHCFAFSEVQYHKEANAWQSLHELALAGNLVSTVGKIQDLSSLPLPPIAFLDISNIADYELLDFSSLEGQQPLLFWVFFQKHGTDVLRYSSLYKALSQDERVFMKEMLEIISQAEGWQEQAHTSLLRLVHQEYIAIGKTPDLLPCYSVCSLDFVKKYFQKRVVYPPSLGYCSVRNPQSLIEKINEMDKEQLQKLRESSAFAEIADDLKLHQSLFLPDVFKEIFDKSLCIIC